MAKPFRRSICWIRRDLRLSDHRPLYEATSKSLQTVVAFVFDTTILDRLEDKDDRRVTFIFQSLQELDENLREHGSKLVVLHGDPTVEIPKLASLIQADAVFAGRDYDPSAIQRDEKVGKALSGLGIEFNLVKDQVVLEAGQVLNKQGHPFKVYTPYAREWRQVFERNRDSANYEPDLAALAPSAELTKCGIDLSFAEIGFKENDLWTPAGESAGHKMLSEFSDRIGQYSEKRDYPAAHATSGLSVHLRFGTVSIRSCIRAALEHGERGDKWFSELVWREFYQDVLANFPKVVHEPFQEQYRQLKYPGDPDWFDAWRKGQTGYPIVDAAMRCFNATGWMHNRLRMIVASFLTKDLLLDYRLGEAYFARFLLDFDLASNNGGWQWAAGVGVDAQPYFRIFNPVLQSHKFDTDGAFIRTWVPELTELDNQEIHLPSGVSEFDLESKGIRLGQTYPKPIVNHETQRNLAIKLLESCRSPAEVRG